MVCTVNDLRVVAVLILVAFASIGETDEPHAFEKGRATATYIQRVEFLQARLKKEKDTLPEDVVRRLLELSPAFWLSDDGDEALGGKVSDQLLNYGFESIVEEFVSQKIKSLKDGETLPSIEIAVSQRVSGSK